MEQLRINPREVKKRMDRGDRVVFVDTRAPAAWETADSVLPGARRIPADQVDRFAGSIPQDALVVSYCTWPKEGSSARAALRFQQLGFKEAYALVGGYDAWRAAGFQTSPKSTEVPGTAPGWGARTR